MNNDKSLGVFWASFTFSFTRYPTTPFPLSGLCRQAQKGAKMEEAYQLAEQLGVPAFVVQDGTTTVIVGMHFSEKARDSVDDKVKRMIKGEVRAGITNEG